MRIDQEKCIGCYRCAAYCTANAISVIECLASVDQEKCLECGNCLRSEVCPTEAIYEIPLDWPRSIRMNSDPLIFKKEFKTPVGHLSRVTSGIKRNELMRKYESGEVGFMISPGRPGVGTTLENVEKIYRAVTGLGVEFQPNLVTSLMIDPKIGKMRKEVLKERILYTDMEFKTEIDRIPEVIEKLREVSNNIDTVFSISIMCRVEADMSIPALTALESLGVSYYPNGKANMGLGRWVGLKTGGGN